MGFINVCSLFVLLLLFTPVICLQLNTDEYFVFEFLEKLGLNPSNNSGLFCEWKGVICAENGDYVVKLEMSGFGLSGTIPETTIVKLVNLEELDLSNNRITGLSSDFWSFVSLKKLNMSRNSITGSLSSNVGNFGGLRVLDISHNNFSGEISESISSLNSLHFLNLGHNRFESTIPLGINRIHSLVWIDLSSNKLIGSLPNGFGAAFPRLRFLNLAENGLHDHDLNFSKSLEYVNVSGNMFTGSIVGVFGENVEVIDLSRNQFSGHFGGSLSLSRLRYLDLSENRLSGEVFDGLRRATNLKHLNLAFNRFSKEQFLQIDSLVHLVYLNLSRANLIGRIPSSIFGLNGLVVIDLSRNSLSNNIPANVATGVKVLDLSYNNLTGDIPLALIEQLNGMDRFNFSYNNLSFCAGLRFSLETIRGSFLGSENSCPIPANPDVSKKRGRKGKRLEIALLATLSAVVLLVAFLFIFFRNRRRRGRLWDLKRVPYPEEESAAGPFSFHTDLTTWTADVKQATSVPVVIFEKPLLNFTFADLLSATSRFDRGTLLAEGRFGPVYGALLPGGIHVAVKVLVHGSTLSDEEAAAELEYLGRVKHPNLVPLTGYCLAGEQRIVIYDYMENGNLQNLLHDLPLGVRTIEDWSADGWENDGNGIQNVGSEGPQTTWGFRHKIALGTARALAFLHHGCAQPIIHRDVKASSVYLDSFLEPRLSDFGLANIFGDHGLDDAIARGSSGYVPPEFFDRGTTAPTPKFDVYGFGVILLELVTGKKPVGDVYPDEKDGNLVSWVRGLVRTNQAITAIDTKIYGTGPDLQMVEALKIGYLCTAESPTKRPTMQQVVGLLKDLERIVR